ncbi:hypothetical protein HYPSUDRAFT_247705 [Hypholoma sublateritium FD-334 SS-4]|uniref:Uncharacterized protein n=1 Tax=Hypholoma sublateritium (strain FD-334 SS-4) TaxID=945553 RepID=A0A0D2LPA5_HYPSF|nr:hypothetical protein HYPSUDRAFT_247705 [Hypholoma sublateritium FD-334 SS-4]
MSSCVFGRRCENSGARSTNVSVFSPRNRLIKRYKSFENVLLAKSRRSTSTQTLLFLIPTDIAMNDRALRDIHALVSQRNCTPSIIKRTGMRAIAGWWRTLDGALSIIRRDDRRAGVNTEHDHISDMQFHSGCEKQRAFAEIRRRAGVSGRRRASGGAGYTTSVAVHGRWVLHGSRSGSVRRRIPGCATDQRDGRKAGLVACGMCGPRASRARQTAQGCAAGIGRWPGLLRLPPMACMFSRYDLLRFPRFNASLPEAGRLVSSAARQCRRTTCSTDRGQLALCPALPARVCWPLRLQTG